MNIQNKILSMDFKLNSSPKLQQSLRPIIYNEKAFKEHLSLAGLITLHSEDAARHRQAGLCPQRIWSGTFIQPRGGPSSCNVSSRDDSLSSLYTAASKHFFLFHGLTASE